MLYVEYLAFKLYSNRAFVVKCNWIKDLKKLSEQLYFFGNKYANNTLKTLIVIAICAQPNHEMFGGRCHRK